MTSALLRSCTHTVKLEVSGGQCFHDLLVDGSDLLPLIEVAVHLLYHGGVQLGKGGGGGGGGAGLLSSVARVDTPKNSMGQPLK